VSLLGRWPDKRDDRERARATTVAVRRREAATRLLWAVPFLAIGVLIVAVPQGTWRTMLASISKAQIGPVSFELRRDLEHAAAIAAPSDAGEDAEKASGGKARSMFELRLRLEAKLTYVAKELLAEENGPTFLTIGSLEYDEYLKRSEARTAIGVLNTRDEQLRALAEDEKKTFLEEAGEFVDGVRASIFWGQVKRRLRGKDIDAGGKRDDLLAGDDENVYWIAPAFAIAEGSGIRTNAEKRLRTGKRSYGVPVERRVVVVPDNSRFKPGSKSTTWPHVVKLAGLRELIESRS
jgi:hypothetical protein